MTKINLYTFHKGIAEHRFDHNNSIALEQELLNQFDVIRHEYVGDGHFIYQGIPIDHGSIVIFEYDDTKQFKLYDFGDHPSLTVKLCNDTNFRGAVIGQYNPKYWDTIVTDPNIRKTIVGGPYPDTVWQLGTNYDAVQEARNLMTLDKRLYWRGSLYNHGVDARYLGVRKSLELLPNYLTESELYFGARHTNPGTGPTDKLNNSNSANYPVFYQMRVYSKALSTTEITQNFNVVRGTYGI
jgi:hypothetical protein